MFGVRPIRLLSECSIIVNNERKNEDEANGSKRTVSKIGGDDGKMQMAWLSC